MFIPLPKYYKPLFSQLLLCLLFLQACSAAAILPLPPLPSGVIQKDTGNSWEISPSGTPQVGLVFYPGGLVSPDAYLPLLAPLAEKGVKVLITKPFLNLAVFDPEAALAIAKKEPQLKWFLAGHSLGGAMAVKAAKKEPSLFAGLALLGAYADKNDAMPELSLPVLSISASLDGLSTPTKIAAAKGYLPASTQYLVIEGGNHAQFGNYGPQQGDGKASIDAASQQQQTRDALLKMIFPAPKPQP
ncbi:MAG: alpha/beta hydrolase [Candidatus Sericytochromatia bacterium]